MCCQRLRYLGTASPVLSSVGVRGIFTSPDSMASTSAKSETIHSNGVQARSLKIPDTWAWPTVDRPEEPSVTMDPFEPIDPHRRFAHLAAGPGAPKGWREGLRVVGLVVEDEDPAGWGQLG